MITLDDHEQNVIIVSAVTFLATILDYIVMQERKIKLEKKVRLIAARSQFIESRIYLVRWILRLSPAELRKSLSKCKVFEPNLFPLLKYFKINTRLL